MRKFKKLISSMLASVMAISMFTSSVYAYIAQDVKNTEFKTQATVLGALGIMVGDADTGTFRPNDSIKRSEATKIGVALMGLSDVANVPGQVTKYPDIAKDYWANGFINTATNHGLVIGDTSGNFRPEDQIKYNEVVTILVRALGYESQAIAKGGYPTGYVAVASSIGLTKGVASAADSLISRGNVAIMAYNALTINLMEQTGFGSNIKFEITNKTLLADKLNTSIVSGKVNAVGSSVLDSGNALSNNGIRIDDKNYTTEKTDIRTILGFNVDAYLNNKTKKIIAVIPADGKNSVLNIDCENIASIENTMSSKSISYWKNSDKDLKTLKANIENSAYVVYNGKKADFSKFAIINSGYISLLDSDSNGKYDIVFINETINYVVDEVYASSQKITDKYLQPTLTLDFKDTSKTVILEKANEYIGIDDLKEWDVVTFTISEDGSIIFGNVSRDKVEGKITEINGSKLHIADRQLSVAANYANSFSIGDEGIFYIDYEGKIAGFDGTKAKSNNYAYLENIALTNGISKTLKLELFTAEGKFEIVEAASKMTVNSSKNLSPDAAYSAIGAKGKLVTFEKNSDGKLIKITTATESIDINEDVFTLNINEENVVYRASSSKLTASDMSVSVGADTLIFDIPNGASKDEYAVRSKAVLVDGGLYDVMVFDVNESRKAGVIIITSTTANADEESDIALVEKVSLAKNNNGDTIHKLYALSGGKAITLNSKNDTVFIKSGSTLIKEGDIIQFRTNAQGDIDAIRVLFDSDASNSESKTHISDKLTTVYGRVTKKFSDSINVQVGSSAAENYEIYDAIVYVYDSSLPKTKVKLGTLADVESYNNDGGRVFMRIYNDIVKEIVVIK